MNKTKISPIALFIIGLLLILGGIAAKESISGIEWVYGIAGLYCWYKAIIFIE
jgi:hypothetical protein